MIVVRSKNGLPASTFEYFLQNEAATQQFARLLAKICKKPLRMYFYGQIGSGKTTFIRAFLHALGVNEKVKSPSFSIIALYEVSGHIIYHVDLYRLADPREIEYLDLVDQINQDTMCCVEWADKGEGYLPQPDLKFSFSFSNEGRLLNVQAESQVGVKSLSQLTTCIEGGEGMA